MKVIMYPAITLDGYIADNDGQCYEWISDDEANYIQLIEESRCAIVGRKTFDQYREDFPFEGDVKTFVYSKTQQESDDDQIEYVSGSPQEILEHIESQGYSQIVISGGGELNGAFAEAGVVSEIIISVYNLTLGEGIPLFGSHKPKLKLELLETKNELPGIVTNHYKVVK